MVENRVGKMREIDEHFHSVQYVYPTLGDGILMATGEGAWELGEFSELIPADYIDSFFDLHEVLVEDVSREDETFELILYYGPTDIECARTRFAATSKKGGVPALHVQTPYLPKGSRIRSKLAIQNSGVQTALISLRYHKY